MSRRLLTPGTLAGACLLLAAAPALAVITALTPLKQILDKHPFIFVAKVQQLLPDRPAMVLTIEENLKGKAPFERLAVNLTGDSEAAKGKHTGALLERLDKGTPVLFFANRRKDLVVAFGYTNGTWFQVEGRAEKDGEKDRFRWTFLHCEPYLRRTYTGTTEALHKVVVDGLAGKSEPPEPNEKEPPGFGPPLKKQSAAPPVGGLYAVIQLPFLGAIAALAALFPAVFGGLALMMKRWVAALSTASILSILFFIQVQFPRWLDWSWLRTPAGFWLTCGALAGLGALWAAQRYRRSFAQGKSDDMQPRKLDRWGLSLLTVSGLVGLYFAWRGGDPVWQSPWLEMLIVWTPIVAAAYFVFAAYFRYGTVTAPPAPDRQNRPAVSAEAVLLWSLAFTCGTAGALEAGRSGRQAGPGFVQNEPATVKASVGPSPKLNPTPLWVFRPEEGGSVMATPCRTPKGVVVAVAHQEGLDRFGRVTCLDLKTGKPLWDFGDNERMEWVFCSPVYADGRIYIGEGLHENKNCRLFCLDAETGKKLWDFRTESHTESTPCVADGRVVFGAGNDGLYCLDAKTGDKLWHYAGEKGLHIDANPVVNDGRVYAGSGLSRTHQVNRIFCLDLKTGNEVWGERVEYSAYGAPTVHNGVVYIGTGNGNFSADKEPVAGLVLARDARTGAEVWNRPLPNSVVGKPAVDGSFVYVGTRDGHCYALDRKTGEIVWKQGAGAPVLASPVLDVCPGCRQTESVYVAGELGLVAALHPLTGNVHWGYDLHEVEKGMPAVEVTATPLVVRDAGPTARRMLLIGCGIGANKNALSPRLYCFEDVTEH